jgi:hypothetical protein
MGHIHWDDGCDMNFWDNKNRETKAIVTEVEGPGIEPDIQGV